MDRNHGIAETLRAVPPIFSGPVRGELAQRIKTWQRQGAVGMANILVNIEKGIEVGAEDVLKWLIGAEKVLHAAPAVIAALATLVGAMEKPLAELAGAAANPINIALDLQTAKDLQATWPQVKAFLVSLGVKF
jgi:hypothetical protein